MSLRKLYETFANVTTLPIEIEEVRDAIVRLGIQDEILLLPTELDIGELCGIFYQYVRREGLYADPQFCTIVVYPANAHIEAQRFVCCKELIHLMDSAVERVSTTERVAELVKKVLGPLTTVDVGIDDFIAAQDKMAAYRCIPLLFPSAARAEAAAMLAAGETTIEKIAEWSCLPEDIVNLVMEENWPEVEKVIIDC